MWIRSIAEKAEEFWIWLGDAGGAEKAVDRYFLLARNTRNTTNTYDAVRLMVPCRYMVGVRCYNSYSMFLV